MWFIGVEVDKRRLHPLLKKILDPPLQHHWGLQPLLFSTSDGDSVMSHKNTHFCLNEWNEEKKIKNKKEQESIQISLNGSFFTTLTWLYFSEYSF